MPIGAVAGLILFAAVVQVEGPTACPTPDLVASRLSGLLPVQNGADGATNIANDHPDRARLIYDQGDLLVLLESADGVALGTRRLPRSYSCEDLAAAAAVSIATWESDVHPEFASSLAARPPRPVAVQAVGSSQPPTRAPWKLNAGVALGFGGSLDVPVAAGDLVISAWLTPPDARNSLRAGFEGQSQRQINLQAGRAFWRRWILDLGFERPVLNDVGRGATDWLRWFATARLAYLDLHGEGFALNHSDHAFDPGVAVGVRTVFARGHWSSWAELAVGLWPVRHDVVAANSPVAARLPAVEAFVRIGAGPGTEP